MQRKKTKISELAKRIRLDMAERSIMAGDHYLTAAAAGEMLGVSSAMANRAMNLLAEKNLLIRHRRRGTFVGPDFDDGQNVARTAVHIIEFLCGETTTDVQAGEMMAALRTVIPDARLVCHFFPENNSVRQIREEVKKMAAHKSFGGLVLSAGSRNIQEDIARCGVPTVLFGSAYPGVDLPYVDLDQAELGRLMAKLAVEARCRRLYFVTREFWREGDTRAFHGITEKAHHAGLGPEAVRLQNVPEMAGESVMQSILGPMIEHAADNSEEPVAFLCRSAAIAKQLYLAAQSCHAWDQQRMTIVFDAAFGGNPQAPPGMFVRSEKSLKEVFSEVARILRALAKHDGEKPASVRMPVVAGNSRPNQTKPSESNSFNICKT